MWLAAVAGLFLSASSRAALRLLAASRRSPLSYPPHWPGPCFLGRFSDFENFLVSHCFTLLGVQVLCSRRTALAGSSISSCAFIRIPGVSPAVEGANAAPLLLRDPLVQYLRLSVSLFVSPAFRRLRFVWRSAFRVQCLFVMCCIFSGIFRVVFPGFFPFGIPKVQRCDNLVDLEKPCKMIIYL